MLRTFSENSRLYRDFVVIILAKNLCFRHKQQYFKNILRTFLAFITKKLRTTEDLMEFEGSYIKTCICLFQYG